MSDIFVKTSSAGSTGWRKASNVFIKNAGQGVAGWRPAIGVWIKNATQWLRVWPLSGIFATRIPYIASSSSAAYEDRIPNSTNPVIRIGTSYFGDNARWDLNGWTASSYTYRWKTYTEFDSEISTLRSGTGSGWTSTTGEDQLPSTIWTTTNSANSDRQFLAFEVVANNSSNSQYNGLSLSTRVKVVRRRPRLVVGTTPSLSITSPKVGDSISYSSSWDLSEAYLPEGNRASIVWYKNSTATTTGGTSVQVGGYSYTVQSSDVNNYIYAIETGFNSGSDYDLGPSTGVEVSAITASVVTQGPPPAPTSLTATSNRTDGVLLQWNSVPGANYYEIYWQSTQGTGPVNQSTFADFGTDNSITTNSFLDTTITGGSTRYYRVRARSSAEAIGSNNSNWFPAPASNAIAGTRLELVLTAPTITSVTPGNVGGPVSVSFTGGSGPFYQAFWWTSTSAPTGQATPDASGSSSPLTDSTGPGTTADQYMYVRSVKTAGELSLGPSTLASAWSAGFKFNMIQPVPENTSSPTLTGTAQVGQTVTFGVGSWINSPTSYSLRLYRGTRFVSQTETLVKDAGNASSSTYVIQPGDAGFYLRAFATATNSGGTSNFGTYTGGQEIGPITVAQVAPTGGTATVNPTSGTAGSTTYTASTSGWSGTPTITYSYAWQRFTNGTFQYDTLGTGTTFSPTAAQNSTALAWRLVVTASNGIAPDGTASTAFTVNSPAVIPTITMGENSLVTSTSGRINWTSTNQASFSSNGVFAGSGTSATFVAATGLSPSTTYTGTVTVTSSTGNTASANYSFTTAAAPPTPNVTQIQAIGLGNTSAPYINFTFTSTAASSLSIQLYRSDTSSTGPWTALSARVIRDTSGSFSIDFSSRTGTVANWYYVDVIPYSGSGATGTAGTLRTSRVRRSTQTTSATLYP